MTGKIIDLTGLKRSSFTTIGHLQPHRDGDDIPTVTVAVDDRAATRDEIIRRLRQRGQTFVCRSDWHARPSNKVIDDWHYHRIAIHHAGNSYSCAANSTDEMRRLQDTQMDDQFDDVGYHYAVDCQGTIYEGRDIRHKGEHIAEGNTGTLGIVMLADLTLRGEAWEHEYADRVPKDWKERLRWMKKWVPDQFSLFHDELTQPQIDATFALVEILNEFFHIDTLGGHRELQRVATGEGRACPGENGMKLVQILRSKFGLKKP